VRSGRDEERSVGGGVARRRLLPIPRCPRRLTSASREDKIDVFRWRLQPLLPPLTDSTPTTPPLLQQTPTAARGADVDRDAASFLTDAQYCEGNRPRHRPRRSFFFNRRPLLRREHAATPTATQLLLQQTSATERGAGRDTDRDAAASLNRCPLLRGRDIDRDAAASLNRRRGRTPEL
jgi:hypothetical protein